MHTCSIRVTTGALSCCGKSGCSGSRGALGSAPVAPAPLGLCADGSRPPRGAPAPPAAPARACRCRDTDARSDPAPGLSLSRITPLPPSSAPRPPGPAAYTSDHAFNNHLGAGFILFCFRQTGECATELFFFLYLRGSQLATSMFA